MRLRIERYANRLWYQTRRPPWPWRLLAAVHAGLFQSRWQRPAAPPAVPVLVVGNLAVGGSGKTPVVIALARYLADLGIQVGVISRGYGTRRRTVRRVEADSDPYVHGDEPVLLAARTGRPVWVARDRRAALDAALAAGVKVVIADDGLQHRRLPRSFEIVLIDGQRGFGNGWLLPAGPLRQPVSRLQSVDAILHRGRPGTPELPGRRFDLRPKGLVRLADGARLDPLSLANRPVSAVCGIANPDQFVQMLESLAMKPVVHAFPDHHPFSPSELEGLARPIVTTAKDAVKLQRIAVAMDEIYVLEVSASLPVELLRTVAEHVQQFGR